MATHLNFTTAANELHLAQSAISVSIRDVEKRVGVRLLDRDTRNVALTHAGSKMLDLARRIIDTQEAASREFEAYLSGDLGELVISALPSLAAVTLPPIVSEFIEGNPRVQLHLRDRVAHLTVEDVRMGRADLGITSSSGLDDEFNVVPLANYPLVAILPPDHALCKEQSVTWRQMAEEPFITIGHGSVQPLIDRAFNVIDVEARSYVEAGSIQSIAGLVSAGLGVSSLPAQAIPLLSFSRAVTKPLTEPTMFQRLAVIWRKDVPQTPIAVRFAAHLRASIAAHDPYAAATRSRSS